MKLSLLSILPLVHLAYSQATANDLKNGGACQDVALLFARGTTEPGNMGSVVGPQLAKAMKAALGNVAVQGIDYGATVAGATSGALNPKNAAGAKKMAQMATQLATDCPNTKVVLSGYSQGAEQVRGALMNMGANNNVMAAVTFGDPLQKTQFQNIDQANTKINCNPTDPVCQSQFVITAAHLSYGNNGDVNDSVQFVSGLMGAANKKAKLAKLKMVKGRSVGARE